MKKIFKVLEEIGDLDADTILDKLTRSMIAVSLVRSGGKMAVVEEETLSGLTTLKLYGPKQKHLEMVPGT